MLSSFWYEKNVVFITILFKLLQWCVIHHPMLLEYNVHTQGNTISSQGSIHTTNKAKKIQDKNYIAENDKKKYEEKLSNIYDFNTNISTDIVSPSDKGNIDAFLLQISSFQPCQKFAIFLILCQYYASSSSISSISSSTRMKYIFNLLYNELHTQNKQLLYQKISTKYTSLLYNPPHTIKSSIYPISSLFRSILYANNSKISNNLFITLLSSKFYGQTIQNIQSSSIREAIQIGRASGRERR